MDDDGQSAISVDREVKDEHASKTVAMMAEAKPTYKSWKKKYRKMRITFDQKMQECEELHKEEQKALALAKRIAIENEYVCWSDTTLGPCGQRSLLTRSFAAGCLISFST